MIVRALSFAGLILGATFATSALSNEASRAAQASSYFSKTCLAAPQRGQMNALAFTRMREFRKLPSLPSSSMVMARFETADGLYAGMASYGATATRDLCTVSVRPTGKPDAMALAVAKAISAANGNAPIRKNRQTVSKGLYRVVLGSFIADVRSARRANWVHINIFRNKGR